MEVAAPWQANLACNFAKKMLGHRQSFAVPELLHANLDDSDVEFKDVSIFAGIRRVWVTKVGGCRPWGFRRALCNFGLDVQVGPIWVASR